MPAERDTFIADSEFDTVARLLAFNTAAPDQWYSFAKLVNSGLADWRQDDFGPVWSKFFDAATQPPSPTACRRWLPEVERFGFADWNREPTANRQPKL